MDNIFSVLNELETPQAQDNGVDYSKLFDTSTEENQIALAASKNLLNSIGQEKTVLDGASIEAAGENINKIIAESPTPVTVNFADDDDDEVANELAKNLDGTDPKELSANRKAAKANNSAKIASKVTVPKKKESALSEVMKEQPLLSGILQQEIAEKGLRFRPSSRLEGLNPDKGFYENNRMDVDPTYNYSNFDRINVGRSVDQVAALTKGFIGPDGKEHSLEELTSSNLFYDENGQAHLLKMQSDDNSVSGWVLKTDKLSSDVKPSDIVSINGGQGFKEDGIGDFLGKKLANGFTSATIRTLGSLMENIYLEDEGFAIQNRWQASIKNKESYIDANTPMHKGDGFFDFNGKQLVGGLVESLGAMLPAIAASAVSGSALAGSFIGGLTMADQINQEMRELGIDGNSRKMAFWATAAMGTATEMGVGALIGGGMQAYAKIGREATRQESSRTLAALIGQEGFDKIAENEAERQIARGIETLGFKAAKEKFGADKVNEFAQKVWGSGDNILGKFNVAIQKNLSTLSKTYAGKAYNTIGEAFATRKAGAVVQNALSEGTQEVTQYLGDLMIKNTSDFFSDEDAPKFNADFNAQEAFDNFALGGISGLVYGLPLQPKAKKVLAENLNMAHVVHQYVQDNRGAAKGYQALMTDLDKEYGQDYWKAIVQTQKLTEEDRQKVNVHMDQAEKIKQDFSAAFETYLSVAKAHPDMVKSDKDKPFLDKVNQRIGGNQFILDYVAAKMALDKAVASNDEASIKEFKDYFASIDNGDFRTSTLLVNAMQDKAEQMRKDDNKYSNSDTLRDWHKTDRGYAAVAKEMRGINTQQVAEENVIDDNILGLTQEDITNKLADKLSHDNPFAFTEEALKDENKKAAGQITEDTRAMELKREFDRAVSSKKEFDKLRGEEARKKDAFGFNKLATDIFSDDTKSLDEKIDSFIGKMDQEVINLVGEDGKSFSTELANAKELEDAVQIAKQAIIADILKNDATATDAANARAEEFGNNPAIQSNLSYAARQPFDALKEMMTKEEKAIQLNHVQQQVLLKDIAAEALANGGDKDLLKELKRLDDKIKAGENITDQQRARLKKAKALALTRRLAQDLNIHLDTTDTLSDDDKRKVRGKVERESGFNDIITIAQNISSLDTVIARIDSILGANEIDERKTQLVKYRKFYGKNIATLLGRLYDSALQDSSELEQLSEDFDRIEDNNAGELYERLYAALFKLGDDIRSGLISQTALKQVMRKMLSDGNFSNATNLSHDAFRLFGQSSSLNYTLDDIDIDSMSDNALGGTGKEFNNSREFFVQMLTLAMGLKADTVAKIKETTHSEFELDKPLAKGGISIEQINTMIAEEAALNLIGTPEGVMLNSFQNLKGLTYLLYTLDLQDANTQALLKRIVKKDVVERIQRLDLNSDNVLLSPSELLVNPIEIIERHEKIIGKENNYFYKGKSYPATQVQAEASELDFFNAIYELGLEAGMSEMDNYEPTWLLTPQLLGIGFGFVAQQHQNPNIVTLIGNAGTGKTAIMMSGMLRHHLRNAGRLSGKKILYVAPSKGLAEGAQKELEAIATDFQGFVFSVKNTTVTSIDDIVADIDDNTVLIVDEFTLLFPNQSIALSNAVKGQTVGLFLGDVNQVNSKIFGQNNAFEDGIYSPTERLLLKKNIFETDDVPGLTVNDLGNSILNISQSFRSGLRSLTLLGGMVRNGTQIVDMQNHKNGSRSVSLPDGSIGKITDSKGVEILTDDKALIDVTAKEISNVIESQEFYSLEDVMIIIPSSDGVMNTLTENGFEQETQQDSKTLSYVANPIAKMIYDRLSTAAKASFADEKTAIQAIEQRIFHFDVNNQGSAGGIAQGLSAYKVFAFSIPANARPLPSKGKTVASFRVSRGDSTRNVAENLQSIVNTMSSRMTHDSMVEGETDNKDKKFGFLAISVSEEAPNGKKQKLFISKVANDAVGSFDNVVENKRVKTDSKDYIGMPNGNSAPPVAASPAASSSSGFKPPKGKKAPAPAKQEKQKYVPLEIKRKNTRPYVVMPDKSTLILKNVQLNPDGSYTLIDKLGGKHKNFSVIIKDGKVAFAKLNTSGTIKMIIDSDYNMTVEQVATPVPDAAPAQSFSVIQEPAAAFSAKVEAAKGNKQNAAVAAMQREKNKQDGGTFYYLNMLNRSASGDLSPMLDTFLHLEKNQGLIGVVVTEMTKDYIAFQFVDKTGTVLSEGRVTEESKNAAAWQKLREIEQQGKGNAITVKIPMNFKSLSFNALDNSKNAKADSEGRLTVVNTENGNTKTEFFVKGEEYVDKMRALGATISFKQETIDGALFNIMYVSFPNSGVTFSQMVHNAAMTGVMSAEFPSGIPKMQRENMEFFDFIGHVYRYNKSQFTRKGNGDLMIGSLKIGRIEAAKDNNGKNVENYIWPENLTDELLNKIFKAIDEKRLRFPLRGQVNENQDVDLNTDDIYKANVFVNNGISGAVSKKTGIEIPSSEGFPFSPFFDFKRVETSVSRVAQQTAEVPVAIIVDEIINPIVTPPATTPVVLPEAQVEETGKRLKSALSEKELKNLNRNDSLFVTAFNESFGSTEQVNAINNSEYANDWQKGVIFSVNNIDYIATIENLTDESGKPTKYVEINTVTKNNDTTNIDDIPFERIVDNRDLDNYVPFQAFEELLYRIVGPSVNSIFGANAFDPNLNKKGLYGLAKQGRIALDVIVGNSGERFVHGVTALHELAHNFISSFSPLAYKEFYEAASIKFGLTPPLMGEPASVALRERVAQEMALYLSKGIARTEATVRKDGTIKIKHLGDAPWYDKLWYAIADTFNYLVSFFKDSSAYEQEAYRLKYGYSKQRYANFLDAVQQYERGIVNEATNSLFDNPEFRLENREEILDTIEEEVNEELENQKAIVNDAFNDDGIYQSMAVQLAQNTIFKSFRYAPLFMAYGYKSMGEIINGLKAARFGAAIKEYQEKAYFFEGYEVIGNELVGEEDENGDVVEVLINAKNAKFFMSVMKLNVINSENLTEQKTIAEIQQDRDLVQRLVAEDRGIYLDMIMSSNRKALENIAGIALGGVNVKQLFKAESYAKNGLHKDSESGKSDSTISVADRYGKIPRLFIATIRRGNSYIRPAAVENILIRIANQLSFAQPNGQSSLNVVLETLSSNHELFFSMSNDPNKIEEILLSDKKEAFFDTLLALDVISKKDRQQLGKEFLDKKSEYSAFLAKGISDSLGLFKDTEQWKDFEVFFNRMLDSRGFTHRGVAMNLQPLLRDLSLAIMASTGDVTTDDKVKAAHALLKQAYQALYGRTNKVTPIEDRPAMRKLLDIFNQKLDALITYNQNSVTDEKVYDKKAQLRVIEEMLEAIKNQESMVNTILSMTQSATKAPLTGVQMRNGSPTVNTIYSNGFSHVASVINQTFDSRFNVDSLSGMTKELEDLEAFLSDKPLSESPFYIQKEVMGDQVIAINVMNGKKNEKKSNLLMSVFVNTEGILEVSMGEANTDGINRARSMNTLGRKLFPAIYFNKALRSSESVATEIERMIGAAVLQHVMAIDLAFNKKSKVDWDRLKNAKYNNTEGNMMFQTLDVKGVLVPVSVSSALVALATHSLYTSKKENLATKQSHKSGAKKFNIRKRNNWYVPNLVETIKSEVDNMYKAWALRSPFAKEETGMEVVSLIVDGGVKDKSGVEKSKLQTRDMNMHHLIHFISGLMKPENNLIIPESPQADRKDSKLVEVRQKGEKMFTFTQAKGNNKGGFEINYPAIFGNLKSTFEMYEEMSKNSILRTYNALIQLAQVNGIEVKATLKEDDTLEDQRTATAILFNEVSKKLAAKGITVDQQMLFRYGLDAQDADVKDGKLAFEKQAMFKFLENENVLTANNLERVKENLSDEEKAKFVKNVMNNHILELAANLPQAYANIVEEMVDGAKINSRTVKYKGKSINVDTLIEAQAISYFLVNANLTPLVMGELTGFKNMAGISKRGKAFSQPYTAVVGDTQTVKAYGTGEQTSLSRKYREQGARALVIQDTKTQGFLFDPTFGKHESYSIADFDGAIFVSPLYSRFIFVGSGGAYGQSEAYGILKTAASQANIPAKGLMVPVSPELFEDVDQNSLRQLRFMLEPHGSGVVARRNNDETIQILSGIPTPFEVLMNTYNTLKDDYGIERMEAFDQAVRKAEEHVAKYSIDIVDVLIPPDSIKRKIRMVDKSNWESMLEGTSGVDGYAHPYNIGKTGINTNFSATTATASPDTTVFQQLISMLVGATTDKNAAIAFNNGQSEAMRDEKNKLLSSIVPGMTLEGLIKDKSQKTLNAILKGLNELAKTSGLDDYMANDRLSMATAKKATETFQLINKRLQKVVKPKLIGLRTADRGHNATAIVEVSWKIGAQIFTESFPTQKLADRFIESLPEAIKATIEVSVPRRLNNSFPALTQSGIAKVLSDFSNQGISGITKTQPAFANSILALVEPMGGLEAFLKAPDKIFLYHDKEAVKDLLTWYGNYCQDLQLQEGMMEYKIGESMSSSILATKYHAPRGASMAELFFAADESNMIDLRTATKESFIENQWFREFKAKELIDDNNIAIDKFLAAVKVLDASRKTLSVRTPSTNAHSGVMTNNIFFIQDIGMITYYSPLDMFARGSDQDGDQSSHYHMLPEGSDDISGVNAKTNNTYIDFAFKYYENPKHFANIFKPINVDVIIATIEGLLNKKKDMPFGSNTGSEKIKSAADGKGIGPFAIYQKAYTFMLQYFESEGINKNTLFPKGEESAMEFFSDLAENINRVMAFTGDVGNAIVDDAKHGIAGPANIIYEFIPMIMYSFNDPFFMEKMENAGLYTRNIDNSEYVSRIEALAHFLTSSQLNEIGNSKNSFYDTGRIENIDLLEVAIRKVAANTNARKGIDQGKVNMIKSSSSSLPEFSSEPLPVINVYWGSSESNTNTRELSNLAPRKFTFKEKEFGSVEHAYQTLKSGSFDKETYDKYVAAGGYGVKIRGKSVNKGFDNLQLMEALVYESFRQNPNKAALLSKYSDFTHNTNEVIDVAFLNGLRRAKKAFGENQKNPDGFIHPLEAIVAQVSSDATVAPNDKITEIEKQIKALKPKEKALVTAYIKAVSDKMPGTVKTIRHLSNQTLLANYVASEINKTISDKNTEGSNKYQNRLTDMKFTLLKSLETILEIQLNGNKDLIKERLALVDSLLTEAISNQQPINGIMETIALKALVKDKKSEGLIKDLFRQVRSEQKWIPENIAKAAELTVEQTRDLAMLVKLGQIGDVEADVQKDELDNDVAPEVYVGNEKSAKARLMEDYNLTEEQYKKLEFVSQKKGKLDDFYKQVKTAEWKFNKTLEKMTSLMYRGSGKYNAIYDMIIDYGIGGKSIMNFATFANLNQFDFNSDFSIYNFEKRIREEFGLTPTEFKDIFGGTQTQAIQKLQDFNFEKRKAIILREKAKKNPKSNQIANVEYSFDGINGAETKKVYADDAVASKADWLMFVATHPTLFEMTQNFILLSELSRSKIHNTKASAKALAHLAAIQEIGGKKNNSEAEYITAVKIIQDFHYAKFLSKYVADNKTYINDLINKGIVSPDGKSVINQEANGKASPIVKNDNVGVQIDLSTPQGIYLFVTNAPNYIYEVIQEYAANVPEAQKKAIENNTFIKDLSIDRTSTRDRLVLEDVEDGSAEEAMYKLGVEQLPDHIKALVRLYMLADGGLGYSKGLSRFMPMSLKAEGDAFISSMMQEDNESVIENTAKEMIEYLEDRIANDPGALLYTSKDAGKSIARNINISTSNEKKDREYDVIYQDANEDLWKLPFGGFAMTVIPGQRNRIKINLEDSTKVTGNPITVEGLAVDKKRAFTYEGTKYSSILDAYKKLSNSDMNAAQKQELVENLTLESFLQNKNDAKLLVPFDNFKVDVTQTDAGSVASINFFYAAALSNVSRVVLTTLNIEKPVTANVFNRELVYPILNMEVIENNNSTEQVKKIRNISERQMKIYDRGTIIHFLDGNKGQVISLNATNRTMSYSLLEADSSTIPVTPKTKVKNTFVANMKANGITNTIEQWLSLGRQLLPNVKIETMTVEQAIKSGYDVEGNSFSFFVASENKVVLLLERVSEDVTIHELFGHAINHQIQKSNKPLWEQMVAMAKQDTVRWDAVSDPNGEYRLKDPNDIADEVISQIMQERFYENRNSQLELPLYQSLFERFKAFLMDAFYKFFPKDFHKALDFNSLTTLEEYTDRLLEIAKTKKYRVAGRFEFANFMNGLYVQSIKKDINHLNSIKNVGVENIRDLFTSSRRLIDKADQRIVLLDNIKAKLTDFSKYELHSVEAKNGKEGFTYYSVTVFIGGQPITYNLTKEHGILDKTTNTIELSDKRKKEIEDLVDYALQFDTEMTNSFYGFLKELSTDKVSLFGALVNDADADKVASREVLLADITKRYFETYRKFLSKVYDINEYGEMDTDKPRMAEKETILREKVLQQVRTTLLHLDFDPMYDTIYIGTDCTQILNIPESMTKDLVIVRKQGAVPNALAQPLVISKLTTSSLNARVADKNSILAAFLTHTENRRKHINKGNNNADLMSLEIAVALATHNYNEKKDNANYGGLRVKTIKALSLNKNNGLQINKEGIKSDVTAKMFSPSETMKQVMEIFNSPDELKGKLSEEAMKILAPEYFNTTSYTVPFTTALDEILSIAETLYSHMDKTELEGFVKDIEGFRREYEGKYQGPSRRKPVRVAINKYIELMEAQYGGNNSLMLLDSRIEAARTLLLELEKREVDLRDSSEPLLNELSKNVVTVEELESPIMKSIRLAFNTLEQAVSSLMKPKMKEADDLMDDLLKAAKIEKSIDDIRITRAASMKVFYRLFQKEMSAMNIKEDENGIAEFPEFDKMTPLSSYSESYNKKGKLDSTLSVERRMDESGTIYERVERDYVDGTKRIYFRREENVGKLHVSINDRNTQDAINRGLLSLEELESSAKFAQHIYDAIVEQVITSQGLYDHKDSEGNPLTRREQEKQAKAWLDSKGFFLGMVPNMKETTAEAFHKEFIENKNKGVLTNIKKGAARIYRSWVKENRNNQDMENVNEEYNDDFSPATTLYDQLNVATNEVILSGYLQGRGLSQDQDSKELITIDHDTAKEASIDLYNIDRYSWYLGFQNRAVEEHFVPVKESVLGLLNMRAAQGMGDQYAQWAEVVNDMYNMLINKKQGNLGNIDLGPWSLNITTMLNMAKSFQSLSLFGFNFWQFPKSITTNTAELMILAKANEKVGRDRMFTTDHLYKALKLLATDEGQTLAKAINNMYGVVLGTPKNLLEDYENAKHLKALVSEDMPHVFMRAPDIMQRYVLMVAQMMAMGTWDAHTLNNDGTVTYDETKDLQYANEDGTVSDAGQKLINLRILKRKDENLQTEHKKLTGAFDSTGVAFLRGLANMKVGSGQGGASKAIFQGKAWGLPFDTFTGSLLPRLKETLFGWNGNGSIGSLDYSYIKDGKLVQYNFTTQSILEGISYYYYEFQKHLNKTGKMSFSKPFEQLDPASQEKMKELVTGTVAFSLYAFAVLGGGAFLLYDDDDDEELRLILQGKKEASYAEQVSLQSRRKMFSTLQNALFESHYHVNPFSIMEGVIEYPTASLIYTKRLMHWWQWAASAGYRKPMTQTNDNLMPINASAFSFLQDTDFEEKQAEMKAKAAEKRAEKQEVEQED